PWYYYLLLIPLYEQIGLVFGIAGLIRCLVRPTRFRLFLAYWFVGNVFIYSWAAEKMPWLMVHLTIPMMLLAAIGLEPIVITAVNFVKERFIQATLTKATTNVEDADSIRAWIPQPRRPIGGFAGSSAIVGVVCAVLLLLPTLHNMYEVAYVHPADGPHEMMVYVQTTTDVNIVMNKIDALDQKLYGGKHQLAIGITNDATWPFAWYVRDYSNVCFNYPTGCSSTAKTIPVIIAAGDSLVSAIPQYSSTYDFHQYHMRSWWSEGYKMPRCSKTVTTGCTLQPTWGVGLGPWLSYGDNPPRNATFNFGLAAQNVWHWWWDRKAIGNTDGAFEMGLFIRKDLGGNP
ncbi:MAG: hypothetical protein M3Z24_12660, partial [Chloroflexota bacterium]|nr:hypothetical protein [Chloroflexota bacterium]